MPPEGWTEVTGENGKVYWRNDGTGQWLDPRTGDMQLDPKKEWTTDNNTKVAVPSGGGGNGKTGGDFTPGPAPEGLIWVEEPVYDPVTGTFKGTRKKLVPDPSYRRPGAETGPKEFDPWRESPEEREKDRQVKKEYQDALLGDKAADRELERIKAEMVNARLRGDSVAQQALAREQLQWEREKNAAASALQTARLKLDERQIDETTGLKKTELMGRDPTGAPTLARDELASQDAYRKAQIALQQGNAEEAKRQFDIAEGFRQRIETAKLQFERERDPASFMSKLFTISGQEAPPGTQRDLGGALNPYTPTVGPRTPAIAALPPTPGATQPVGAPGTKPAERPWWEHYSHERLERFPDEELMTLPPAVLATFRNEFFLKRPALMAMLPPERVRGEGKWQGTGFAQDIINKFGKGAPVPGPTSIPRLQTLGMLDASTLAGDEGQSIPKWEPIGGGGAVTYPPSPVPPPSTGIWEPIGGNAPLAPAPPAMVDRPDLQPQIAQPVGPFSPATAVDPRFRPMKPPSAVRF